MADEPKRPPIRVRFRFNVDTGDLELIIDDDSPDRSDAYHDQVAEAIASYLARNPDIEDAGAIRHRLDQEWQALIEAHEKKEKEPEKDTLTD